MAIVCNTYQSTRDFSYKDRLFTAEASTIQKGLPRPHDGRVYDDACDVGFIMVSAETGDAILFVHHDTDYSGKGDDREIAGWRYEATYFAGPSGKWVKLPPHLEKISCLVIND